MSATIVASTTLFCGFCGKSHHQVRKMIAGPATKPGNATNICDECVDLCALILAEEGMLRLPPALDHQMRAIARAEIENNAERMSVALRSGLTDLGDRVPELPPLAEGLS